MLLRLSKNAFVRQYGEFTYVLERVKCYDQMFKDAEVFMRWITRAPMEKGEILKNICSVYVGADEKEIARDFDEFIAPLIDEKVILAGETEDELDSQEISFSYDVENPKTMYTHYIKPEDMPEGPIPQDVLEKYFCRTSNDLRPYVHARAAFLRRREAQSPGRGRGLGITIGKGDSSSGATSLHIMRRSAERSRDCMEAVGKV